MNDSNDNTNKTTEVTPSFMYDLFLGGLIGTKEFRGWLAKRDTDFGEVRDQDIDNEIDRLARERTEALHANQSQKNVDNSS